MLAYMEGLCTIFKNFAANYRYYYRPPVFYNVHSFTNQQFFLYTFWGVKGVSRVYSLYTLENVYDHE